MPMFNLRDKIGPFYRYGELDINIDIFELILKLEQWQEKNVFVRLEQYEQVKNLIKHIISKYNNYFRPKAAIS